MSNEVRPGFSLLVCPDSRLLLDEIDSKLAKNQPASGSWEWKTFWGDEEPGGSFWHSLRQRSLFASPTALIVRNAQEWPAAVWKKLSDVLAMPDSAIWLFLCLESSWEKGKPKIPAWILKSGCYGHAEKSGWVWQKAPLAGVELKKYVEKAAKIRGVAFTGNALSLFCAQVPPDANAITSELDKLSLCIPKGQISPEHLANIAPTGENDAFALIRMLKNGDLASALKEAVKGDANSLLFFLIALLSREIRTLWQINAGESPYLHPSEASFMRQLAKKLSAKRLGEAFAILAEADWRVKSGAATPGQSLEYLLVQIGSVFKDF